MQLDDFVGKPCRSKTAYEFMPKKRLKVDLGKASEEINSVGAVEVNSKVLLIARIGDATVSLFPTGKILVRGQREEALARKTAQKLVESLRESIK